ncbi:MAG: DMT family transporter [Proteobacteria bacterium]|nr:DMT family transporter [Pseudomonadota bacterium]
MKSSKTNNVLAIILVMVLWAICYPLIVMGLNFAPHITFAAMRASIAGVILLIVAGFLGEKQPQEPMQWLYMMLIGLGATTFGFYGMFHASEFVSPGVATVITNIQPMLTAILALWWLQESINKNEIAAVILGFIGVVIIATSDVEQGSTINIIGLSYVAVAVFGLSVSNVLIKKITGKINALVAMGWQLVFGSLILWVMALMTESQAQINWNLQFLTSLISLSVFGTALAYWLWFRVLENVDLMFANSFSFLVPAFGLILGMAFFNEIIGGQVAIGIAIIFIGIILVNLPQKKTLIC